jgi:hypothetical protein
MVILKATSFLEEHKRDMSMMFRITPSVPYMITCLKMEK